MKSLVIAEKPSVARDIARVLGCHKKNNGFIEGTQYIITWGLGHLVTLADPEQYDKKYKDWNMEQLPMIPEQFQLSVIGQTAKQYNIVKSQIYRKEVSDIIIATDAGREGELVARLILKKAGNKKPIRRLWISSVTDKAIKEGFSHLKDGREYESLYEAAICRAQADWLVGINATRALTCRYNAQLSCGRVQTPTLAMIAKREQQRKEFQPKPYFGITIKIETPSISFVWKDKNSNSNYSFEKQKVESIMDLIKGESLLITDIKKVKKKTAPPLLYDLTQLQREANEKYHFSAKETLNIMQRLYEHHKVLTYPRTDSRYLTSDIIPTIKERLRAIQIGSYKTIVSSLLKETIKAKPSFVNDKKVSDHHAIIPTEQYVQLESMSLEERKIYDLVVRRFLAVLLPDLEFEQTTITAKIKEELFTVSGKVTRQLGWKTVYEKEEIEENKIEELPTLQVGQKLKLNSIVRTEGRTKPPALFNESTLLSAMENPIAFLESSQSKEAKTLTKTGGLGTVATRADIIEKLFSSFLLEKQGQDISLTSKARQLLNLVPQDLKKPELTASWEQKLADISDGKLKKEVFMREICDYTEELISQIKSEEGVFRHDNITNHKCPECGKRMLLVKGKNNELYVCQDRACGYREVIARTTNARCPSCHKRLQLRGKGEGQVFVCVCGYKEKLTAFQERRKKEGAGISKKEVKAYLEKQKKQEKEPINQAFAQAFAKLNITAQSPTKKS